MTGERIPEDIRAAVDAIFDGVMADESLADAIARALLAERERAAKILTDYAGRVELVSKDGHGGDSRWTWQGVRAQVLELAKAIRA